jgi:FAD:protein FMN transferase
VTATASAGTCLDANMLTTAAIVRGEAGLEWLTGLGCPLRLVRHDGVVVRLGGWPEEPPR